MRGKRLGNNLGISLIELLVVVAVMGVIGTALFSLYFNSTRTSTATEETIEVQQNLRIALDQLNKDLRMAGFLIPSGTALLSAPQTPMDLNADGDCDDAGEACLTIQTAAPFGIASRVQSSILIDAGIDDVTPKDIEIALSPMVDFYNVADSLRIIRPANGSSIGGNTAAALVSALDRDVPELTLLGLAEYAGEQVNAGDILVRVAAGSTHPGLIRYFLQDSPASSDPALFDLIRNDGVANETVATQISGLTLTYLLDDGTETSAPDAAQLERIGAVRVLLTGQTDLSKSAKFSGVKTRQATGVARLRNR